MRAQDAEAATTDSAVVPTASEAAGWARLIAGVADEAVAGNVQAMHRAITRGAFRWVGPLGRPVERLHDAVVDHTYAVIRGGIRGGGELAAAVATARPARREPSPTARRTRAIAQAVIDERYLAVAPELDIEVAIRHDGRSIVPTAGELAAAYPAARSHLVVFLHGLTQSEAGWFPRGQAQGLPDVAVDAGATPVLLRYGTGRAIARNADDVARLLEALVAGWPVPVERVTLVGHSMGGLVARAACDVGRRAGSRWVDAVTDVLYLATPHRGSWLEDVARATIWTLERSSTRSAPIGRLLEGRSRGIKDLHSSRRADTAADEVATPSDPPTTAAAEVSHHLVVGRLRPTEKHPLNLLLGDGLVRFPSATRLSESGTGQVTMVAASHTRLIHAPEVALVLADVVGTRSA